VTGEGESWVWMWVWVWVVSEAEQEGVVVVASHLQLVCMHLSVIVVVVVVGGGADSMTSVESWVDLVSIASTDASVLTSIEIIECVQLTSSASGEIENRIRRSGRSCVALDLAFFWSNSSAQSLAMAKGKAKGRNKHFKMHSRTSLWPP
jgi:hypothetical protein